jgi:hypothetical protein
MRQRSRADQQFLGVHPRVLAERDEALRVLALLRHVLRRCGAALDLRGHPAHQLGHGDLDHLPRRNVRVRRVRGGRDGVSAVGEDAALVERDELVALRDDDLRLQQPRLVLDTDRRRGLHELHARRGLSGADVRSSRRI